MGALESSGLHTSGVPHLRTQHPPCRRPGQYVGVNDGEKNLVVAMADRTVFRTRSFPSFWRSAVAGAKPKWLVVDGNWSEQDLCVWLRAARETHCRVAFEPVSAAK